MSSVAIRQIYIKLVKICHAAQAAADAMLAAVQRTVLAAGQALGRTAEAAAGCRGATDSALSAQSAALSGFQQQFATSMAQDQVQPSYHDTPTCNMFSVEARTACLCVLEHAQHTPAEA